MRAELPYSASCGTSPIVCDVVVVGAGPAGLFQAFQLGLHEIHAHVVDALPYAGGQCIQLYPDKFIYDIPAFAVCGAADLARRLVQQAAIFCPQYHFGVTVDGLNAQPDGRFLLTGTRVGNGNIQQWRARCIIVAAGVGAFMPRQVNVEGLSAFWGTQVFYPPLQKSHVLPSGAHMVVWGGGDAAVQQVLSLAGRRGGEALFPRVTLLHRRAALQADEALQRALKPWIDTGQVQQVVGQPVEIIAENGAMRALRIEMVGGGRRDLEAEVLWVCQGISPRTSPMRDWGLLDAHKQIPVNPATFSTAMPGVFAVGDIASYPGKRKLIVSAFHEASLAAFGVASYLRGGESVALHYTSSNTRLQRLFRVDSNRQE